MLLSVVFILVSFICLAVGHWMYNRYKCLQLFERMGIPYVPANLIDGNFRELRGQDMNSMDVISSWVKKYGKVFGYFVGYRATICISDLDMVKQILIKDFNAFANRPKMSIKTEPVMSTLVGLRDQRWKDVRSLLTPTFSFSKMKLMAGVINKKVDLMINILQEKQKSGQPIEMYSTYQCLTLDVICECALAIESKCQTDENDHLIHAVREFLQNAINPFVILALYFPFFGKVLSVFANKLAYSGKMTSFIMRHLDNVISYRRKNNGVKTIDVLQLMLEASDTELDVKQNSETSKSNAGKTNLSDAEISANAWVFLMAGFETTANALSFTSHLLAKHKDVQQKLYEEIKSVLKDDTSVSYEQVSQMQYLDQVLNESLRVYPPVVSFITRQAEKDIQVGSIVIPKDVTVSIPIKDLHHDESQWPNPEVFDPDRFSAEAKASRHPMAFLPFGDGPRNCIGKRFGLLEAKVALARVVQCFELDFSPMTLDPPPIIVPTVAINPSKGIHLRLTPRNQLS